MVLVVHRPFLNDGGLHGNITNLGLWDTIEGFFLKLEEQVPIAKVKETIFKDKCEDYEYNNDSMQGCS